MLKKLLIFLSIFIIILFPVGCSNKESDGIESVEDLINGTYVIGVPYLTYCQEQAPSLFVNASEFRSYGDMPAAYKALQQGKIAALIQDEVAGRVEISNGVDGVKILDTIPEICASIAVGISPKSTVVNETNINSVINSLIDDSIIQDMRNRWVVNADYDMPLIEVPTGDLPVVKISTCGVVEPFSFYRNNEICGFDIELSKRIAKALNVKIEFDINPDFDSMIASVQSGKTDLLISNLYVTTERKEQMPLSVPYLSTRGCVIVKDNSIGGYSSLEELKNKKIGYDSSSTQFEKILSDNFPDAEPVLYNNTPDSIMGLQKNRVDAIITDLPNAKYVVETTDGLMIVPEYIAEDYYGYALKKDSPYTDEFNEVLERFKNQNVLKDLEEKWFTDIKNTNKEMTKQDPNKTYDKTIKAVTTALLEPMCFLDKDNNICGYEAELLLLICNELNYKVEFLPCVNSIGSVLANLEAGRCDVCFSSLSISEERREKFDLTDSYYDGAAVLIVRNDAALEKPFFERLANSFNKTFVVEERWKMILDGLYVTLIISICSGVLGLLIGFGLCILRRGNNKPLNAFLKGIIKLIQGAPIVVFLMIMYYIVFGNTDINAIIVAIFAFGINFGVYASEIMKSGFDVVDPGQIEAARALGYSKVQTFFKISFPQATKKFIPVLRQEFISMVKMTSVAGYISVAELTRVGDIIRSKTMEAFFPLIVIAIIYFALSELLTFSLTLLEKRLDSKNRPFKLKGDK